MDVTVKRGLNELTATEIVAKIAAGEITCEAVTRDCIQRIAAREAIVKAWVNFNPELALAQAHALDREPCRGPLHGVPIGVKDVIDTFDMPTEMGSPIYRGYRPTADAACVALLRRAGAVILEPADDPNFGILDYLHEVDYPEVMKRDWFCKGIDRLLELADEQTTAVMCSEENPAQCHRHHLIAKYLMANHPEVKVTHIRGNGTAYGATSIPETVEAPSGEQLSLF